MPLKLVRHLKRSPHWYLRGTVRGESVFETTGTDDRKAAEAIRIKRESGILNRSIFGAGATVTFAEAAVSYLEKGGEARFLGAYDPDKDEWSLLIGRFMATPVVDIGQVEADAAANALYPGTKASTRRRQVYSPINAVRNHAAKKWKISVQKIEGPKVKDVPVEWAPPVYVTKLLPECDEYLRLYIVSLVYSGGRLAEIHRIDWDRDIDLSVRQVTLRRTKNGKMRTVPIHDQWLVEMAKVPEANRHGPLFHWKRKTGPYKALQNACKRAGLPYLSPHKLGRHTYATWLRRYAKRDLKGLQHDGGWDSINSVVKYAHVVPGETEQAIPLLPAVQNACSDVAAGVETQQKQSHARKAKRLGKG